MRNRQCLVWVDAPTTYVGRSLLALLEGRRDVVLCADARSPYQVPRGGTRPPKGVDYIFLCGNPESASEYIASAREGSRIIDLTGAGVGNASAVCGFPELSAGQRVAIAEAQLVSIPHPAVVALLALLSPLRSVLDCGGLKSLVAHSVMGKSGDALEHASVCGREESQYVVHMKNELGRPALELARWGDFMRSVRLVSAVGGFSRGFMLQLLIPQMGFLRRLPHGAVTQLIQSYYHGSNAVRVHRGVEPVPVEGDNNSGCLSLFIHESNSGEDVLLVARMDNLGKGSAGAAMSILQLGLDYIRQRDNSSGA